MRCEWAWVNSVCQRETSRCCVQVFFTHERKWHLSLCVPNVFPNQLDPAKWNEIMHWLQELQHQNTRTWYRNWAVLAHFLLRMGQIPFRNWRFFHYFNMKIDFLLWYLGTLHSNNMCFQTAIPTISIAQKCSFFAQFWHNGIRSQLFIGSWPSKNLIEKNLHILWIFLPLNEQNQWL